MPTAKLIRITDKEEVIECGKPGRNFKWRTKAQREGYYKARFDFYQSLPAAVWGKLIGKPPPHFVESDSIYWDGVSDEYISFTRANLTRAKASFRADAPWRIQSEQSLLPILLQIVDPPSGDKALKLSDIVIYDKTGKERVSNNNLHYVKDETGNEVRDKDVPSILKKSSDGTETIETHGQYSHQWYRIIYLEPSKLSQDKRRNIHLCVKFSFKNHSPFEMHLRVLVGQKPLPKLNDDWHYGDIHFHSEHTNNPTEFGGPKIMAMAAGKSLGLSWVNLTDHSCDFEDSELSATQSELSEIQSEFHTMQEECRSLSRKGDFILIPSEEVTIDKPKGDYLHLLSRTSNFIKGSFYGTYTLEEVLIGKGNKPMIDIRKREFAFAAHPEAPKIDWEIEDKDYEIGLKSPALKGLQIFNCRASKFLPLKDPDTYVNYFKLLDLSWWSRIRLFLCRRTINFRNEWTRGLEKWDTFLCERLTNKDMKELFIAGGSDAHGDFNYGILRNAFFVGNLMFDNAFGRTRTAVYLTGKDKSLELTETNILSALTEGRSVVTDGPLVNFIISGGDGTKARLGETLNIKGKSLKFYIEWLSTLEFGTVRRIVIKKRFLNHEGKPSWEWLKIYRPGRKENIQGNLTFYHDQDEEIAYYRSEAISIPKWSIEGRERYSCYTNPIWVRIATPKDA